MPAVIAPSRVSSSSVSCVASSVAAASTWPRTRSPAALEGAAAEGGAGLGDAVLGGLEGREGVLERGEVDAAVVGDRACRGRGCPGRRSRGPGPVRVWSRAVVTAWTAAGVAPRTGIAAATSQSGPSTVSAAALADSAAAVRDGLGGGEVGRGDRVAGRQQVVTARAEVGVGAAGAQGQSRRPR